jgi:hypothetical protein
MRECESWDVAQAFSTYLHETIHWWQHVGTSAGLMLTRQWLVEDGSFAYDYGWLTSKFSTAELKDWADDVFKASTGVHPDAFSVLR